MLASVRRLTEGFAAADKILTTFGASSVNAGAGLNAIQQNAAKARASLIDILDAADKAGGGLSNLEAKSTSAAASFARNWINAADQVKQSFKTLAPPGAQTVPGDKSAFGTAPPSRPPLAPPGIGPSSPLPPGPPSRSPLTPPGVQAVPAGQSAYGTPQAMASGTLAPPSAIADPARVRKDKEDEDRIKQLSEFARQHAHDRQQEENLRRQNERQSNQENRQAQQQRDREERQLAQQQAREARQVAQQRRQAEQQLAQEQIQAARRAQFAWMNFGHNLLNLAGQATQRMAGLASNLIPGVGNIIAGAKQGGFTGWTTGAAAGAAAGSPFGPVGIGVGTTIGALAGGKIGMDMGGQLEAGIQGATMAVNLLESALQRAWNMAKEFAVSVVTIGMEFQKTLTAFNVFTGSLSEGKKLFADMQEMAITTPYNLRQMTDISQTLLAMGVPSDNLVKTMSQLGDVAAGDADRFRRLALAFGEVQAEGRLTGQRLRQFAAAGVGVKDIAASLGVPENRIRSMMRGEGGHASMGISSQEVVKLFDDLTAAGGRFFQMSLQQSNTLAGQWSNLTDKMEILKGKLGTALFEKTGVARGIGMVGQKIGETFLVQEGEGKGEIKPEILERISKLVPIVQAAFTGLFQAVQQGWTVAAATLEKFFGKLDSSPESLERIRSKVLQVTSSVIRGIALIAQALISLVSYAIDKFVVPMLDKLPTIMGFIGVGGKKSPGESTSWRESITGISEKGTQAGEIMRDEIKGMIGGLRSGLDDAGNNIIEALNKIARRLTGEAEPGKALGQPLTIPGDILLDPSKDPARVLNRMMGRPEETERKHDIEKMLDIVTPKMISSYGKIIPWMGQGPSTRQHTTRRQLEEEYRKDPGSLFERFDQVTGGEAPPTLAPATLPAIISQQAIEKTRGALGTLFGGGGITIPNDNRIPEWMRGKDVGISGIVKAVSQFVSPVKPLPGRSPEAVETVQEMQKNLREGLSPLDKFAKTSREITEFYDVERAKEDRPGFMGPKVAGMQEAQFQAMAFQTGIADKFRGVVDPLKNLPAAAGIGSREAADIIAESSIDSTINIEDLLGVANKEAEERKAELVKISNYLNEHGGTLKGILDKTQPPALGAIGGN